MGVTKQLLAEEVYQRVGASIIDGTLPPGHRIRDAELAAQFSVSRMPIREALQRLERIGLVEMYPSRYTQVTEVSPALTVKTREFAGYIEGAIAAIAVPRLNPEERTEAAQRALGMTDALEDGNAFSATRWAFIQYLAERSDNEIFRTVLDETSMLLFRNLRPWSLSAAEIDRMRTIHTQLAHAILAGDGSAAERLVRAMHLVD
ncbi:GntR family transcriptional regulator [Microbacterium panaciterrae]|uniref:GntR family transcriptional regulator n=1 Tax=Microbacterium panaciterrae TaxID=985759 RepID=UPI0031E5CDB9